MKISEVSVEDGRMCVQLIKLISSGRWDLSGADAEALVATKRWIQSLAMVMGEQLKTKPAEPAAPVSSTEGFKVKSMGSLPTATKRSRKK
jgi:hypothetical protein